MQDPTKRRQFTTALLSGCILLAGAAGYGFWVYKRFLQPTAPPAESSWLSEGGQQAPAVVPNTSPAQTGPRKPLEKRQGYMPNFTLLTMEKAEHTIYDGDVAPAVVTEWLLGCPDCQPAFRLYPKLAALIKEYGETSKNVAYMGEGHVRRLEQYFSSRDFAGPILLDKGSQLQRHYRIGTFTVWLLEPDGRVVFQGTPAQALPHLEAHLQRRAAARGD